MKKKEQLFKRLVGRKRRGKGTKIERKKQRIGEKRKRGLAAVGARSTRRGGEGEGHPLSDRERGPRRTK